MIPVQDLNSFKFFYRDLLCTRHSFCTAPMAARFELLILKTEGCVLFVCCD